jgi:hypothetical protein
MFTASLLAERGPDRGGKKVRTELAALVAQVDSHSASHVEAIAPPAPAVSAPVIEPSRVAHAVPGGAAREDDEWTEPALWGSAEIGRGAHSVLGEEEPLEALRSLATVDSPAPLESSPPTSLPLLHHLAVDLEALKRGADQFFARLSRLTEFGKGLSGSTRLLPWIVLAAAAALEFNRRRQKKLAQQRLPANLLAGSAVVLPEAP